MILNLDFYPFKSRLIFEKTTNQFSTQLTSKLNGTVVISFGCVALFIVLSIIEHLRKVLYMS